MVANHFTVRMLIDANAASGRKFPLPKKSQAGEKDPFLEALLELPSAHHVRRNPLEWAVSLLVHVTLLAALIVAPLYFTDSINVNAYGVTMLVAVPPPPPPPPPAAGLAKEPARPGLMDMARLGLTVPMFIPRQIAIVHDPVAPDDSGGVVGGVPGGIPGGVPGGVIGGVLGSVG
jgi:hypothetical protein